MEDVLATQNQIIGAIEQLLINFKKDSSDRKTAEHIKRRLNTLKSYWQEFQDNHAQLCEFGDKSHTYFTNHLYESTVEYYNNTKLYIQKYNLKVNPQKEAQPSPFTILKPATPMATPSFLSSHPDVKSQGTSSKLDEMLRKQASNFKAFSRSISSIDFANITEKWELEDTLKTIQSRWSVIDSLHWEIDSELAGENEQYEQTFGRYEQKYNEMKKEINMKLWAASQNRNKIIPQMDIPTFSGNYSHWVSFKDLFTEVIHSNMSLSNAQKMQFLKGKLKGDAEKLIQHLHISTDNYKTCWDILNNRYNNKKLTFSSHLNVLLNLPNLQHQSAGHIKRMHDTTNECLFAINNLGVDTTTWDPLLVHILSQKLDAQTLGNYIDSLENPRELPNLNDFLGFLESKFTSLEASHRNTQKPSYQQTGVPSVSAKPPFHASLKKNLYPSTKTLNHFKNNSFHSTGIKCPLCTFNHGLFHCETFLKLQPDAKRKTVAKLNICKNCLFHHNGNECISNKKCRKCNGSHNTLLHDAYSKSWNMTPGASTASIAASGADDNRKTQQNTHVSQEDISETLLATAQINVRTADGSYQTMRALIDQGSQISLISENAAQRLGLPREHCKGVIFGVGAKENNSKGIINITCSAIHNDYSFNTNAVIMKQLINNLPNSSFKRPSWPYLENIQLADNDFNISRPVDILLGADIYSSIMLGGIIRENQSQPIAQQTHLGWILCGNVQKLQCNVVLNNIDEIKRFWEIEDIEENSELSAEDYQCVQYYKSTTKRKRDGRYEVRLPLKPDLHEKLGASKPMAIAQFHQLERKFIKQKQIAEDYKLFIEEYMELGHMRPCNGNKTPGCYLPHHCVQRADSLTTSLRVVFNASAKTTTGYSLNDLMKRGPNLQQDLLSLILKWRQYQFAFTADIEKMFRQILLNEDDQQYQKIIWRKSAQQFLDEYQLSTVTYSTKAAPFLAMMTLKQLTSDEGHKFQSSQAAKVLEEDFYMDDLVSGSYSMDSAKQLKTDLIELLSKGGFNLRKWTSNKMELLDGILCKQETFDFKQLESTKTLGLRWHPQNDKLKFELKINPSSTKPTKRNLLSDISKIFDPLGWLSPVTTKLKLLFQRVWLSNIKWDDNIPDHINTEWTNIRQDLQNINKLEVQRWLESNENDNIELHGFCDSSTKAYACVIYCKINKKNYQSPSVVLVAAKARLVSENKKMSLPRLELCGAHLLSKLMHKVQHCLSGHNIQLFGWTDSTAVLGWLQGDPCRWKTFVATRVTQISTVMPGDCWRYVKSAENPADCASRGITASQLTAHMLWWNGPTWLPSFEKQEHIVRPTYVTDQDIRKSKQSNVSVHQSNGDVLNELLSKHSSFTRAVRVLAWILRAISHKCDRKLPYLTIEELRRTKIKLIKHTQQLEFADDMNKLQTRNKVDSKSKILNLTPFIDDNELLRVGGRLKHANINLNMKHPWIIPHNSRLTYLLIDHAHKLTFHGGARLTLSNLRQQYWIIGGNRAVKNHLRNCVKCKIHNPLKQHQLMGELPEARTNPTRPFYHTGVDFTGHVDVKANKGRGVKTTKGYIAVFVCMVTKAVHLELVTDLSSSSFLAALRRMSARRGTPRHVYSDNGTNFLGASRTIEHEFLNLQHTLSTEFFTEIAEMDLEWHFNAPSWPSAGGLWEAAVKSLKYHLRRVVGEQKLTYEEFSTLLAQLEACLNARPLCALTEDPDDLNYLTPSHFLASGPTLSIIETERDERTRWQLTQKIFQDIWKRWKCEYLSQLSVRSKWKQPEANIKVDDVVIIHQNNLPAGKWALGRVTELHPGKDGYVRVVTVKTKNGLIKRPIVKLSLLPVKKASDENQSKTQEKAPSEPALNKAMGSRRHRTPNYISMIISFILFVTMISKSYAAYNITALSNHQGLYFDKLATMHLVRDEWKLILYYNMSPYWQQTAAFIKYSKHLENICAKLPDQTYCDIIILQLHHGITELEHNNHMLLNQHFNLRSRERRGLINGVGYIAHSLFGVLDERFAEQYERDITLLRNNERNLMSLWKNQTSIVEAEYNLLKRTENTMNKQHKFINKYMNDMEKATNTLKKEVENIEYSNDFTLSAIIANSILTNLKNTQDTLINTVTSTFNGKFNVHLMTPGQLQNELNIISGQLSKDLSLPISNIQTDLRKMYHILKLKARMTEQYLIFEVKIPLISRDSYDIYKIIAIPQRVKTNMVSIVPIADHVAINLQRDSYLPMSENNIRDCSQYESSAYLCHLPIPTYQIYSSVSLCMKETKTNVCKTNIATCHNKWTELSIVNTYLYFYCQQCALRIICEDQVTVEQVNQAGIIVLGQGCIIKSTGFTVHSHKQYSNMLNVQSDIYIPLIPPINHVINISIPLNRIDPENSDHQSALKDIGNRIEQIKQQQVLAEQVSYHDVHHYSAIYFLVAAAGTAGALCALRRSRRSRSARLAPVQRSPDHKNSDSVSVSVHSLSERAKLPDVNQFSDSDKGARQNKATSPIFRKSVFTIGEDCV